LSSAEITGTVAADIVHDMLSLFMAESPPDSPKEVVKEEL
jgi:hypothetical protein